MGSQGHGRVTAVEFHEAATLTEPAATARRSCCSSTDLRVLTNSRPVAKSLMEKAGFKVDMQDMDWQSVSRRSGRGAPSQGRWSAS